MWVLAMTLRALRAYLSFLVPRTSRPCFHGGSKLWTCLMRFPFGGWLHPRCCRLPSSIFILFNVLLCPVGFKGNLSLLEISKKQNKKNKGASQQMEAFGWCKLKPPQNRHSDRIQVCQPVRLRLHDRKGRANQLAITQAN